MKAKQFYNYDRIFPSNLIFMDNSTISSTAATLKELQPIVDNLLLLLSDKEKVVIKKRFNFDGKRKYTLEEIGKEFSVTRERIRQIENSALSKMKRNVFNTALKYLHEYITDLVNENGGIMSAKELYQSLDEVISDRNSLDENRVRLSLFLHEDFEFINNTIDFYPHIRKKGISDHAIRHASDQLIAQLNKYGDVKPVDKVYGDLQNIFDQLDFDRQRTKSLVNIDKRLILLDNDIVGLLQWRHIHPRTLRDKILFILRNENKPLHFNYIAEKIESANFDNKSVNVQAVHNELIRHDQFVLVGRGIYALGEWGYEKGTVAEVIEAILKKKKELEQEEIVNLVLKQRQVKKITIVLALKNGKKFERVGRKRYKLKA